MSDPTLGGVVMRPGLHLQVGEADYRYGRGEIHLVVRAAVQVVVADGESWVELDTDQVLWNNTTTRRLVQVRVAALRNGLRPPTG